MLNQDHGPHPPRRQWSLSSAAASPGLFCALETGPRPVTVISAAPLGQGASTAWAQGGIAAAVAEGDSAEAHAARYGRRRRGVWSMRAVALGLAREAGARIRDLLHYASRSIATSKAARRRPRAAHSARRIVHVRGDMAGKAIMSALIEAVRSTPSIRVLEGYVAEALLTWDGAVAGLQLRQVGDAAAKPVTVASRAVVLATGGIGHLYAVTTNPPEASGLGLAIAARAGAVIADPEFVQFHPTAIMVGRDPAPLATEALRGEGATLINDKGERLHAGQHKLAELAPRDIVARGVFAEIAAGHGAFLDAREALGAHSPKNFRPSMQTAWSPASIRRNSRSRWRLPRTIIWAASRWTTTAHVVERTMGRRRVSSTGAHGANRLASNSLLEAVVYAARIAEDINGSTIAASAHPPAAPIISRNCAMPPITERNLRAMMTTAYRRDPR